MAKKQFPDAVLYFRQPLPLQRFFKKSHGNFERFQPDVEVYSIDEAFVGLSGLKKLYKMNYFQIGKIHKGKIKSELGINVSIGVSMSKVLAKLACERAKNDEGICLISKSKIRKF